MSQEIIYTSAPQGLRPGSFGFCTVATTAGMASTVAERLESLSGYRHVFPPDHPRAGKNPVVHSHLVLKVGGLKLHVLSRIADAGFDYTQRTNKLAHHIALEPSELVASGPAWLLLQPGFMETAWQSTPKVMQAGRKPATADMSRGVCRLWEQMTGDAGWAGILTQHALQGQRPAHIVFPIGFDPLPLIVEAQSLLAPAKRWEVSFSTYFTRLPPGVECQWRCVLAESPEAQAVTHLRGDLVLDLTHKLGPAPDGPLVESARTGVFPLEPAPPATIARPTPAATAAAVQPVRPLHESAVDELRLGPPPAPPAGRHSALGRPIPPPPPALAVLPTLPRKHRGRVLRRLGGVTAALMLLAIGGAGGFVLRGVIDSANSTTPQRTEIVQGTLTSESESLERIGHKPTPTHEARNTQAEENAETEHANQPGSQLHSIEPRATPIANPPPPGGDQLAPKSAAPLPQAPVATATAIPASTSATPIVDPSNSETKPDLPAPATASANILAFGPEPEQSIIEDVDGPICLATFQTGNRPAIDSILLVGERGFSPALTFESIMDNHWQITVKTLGGNEPVATVYMEGNQLKFEWKKRRTDNAGRFVPYCSLIIGINGQIPRPIYLSNPTKVAPIKLRTCLQIA